MTGKQFAKYLARDHRCLHCGTEQSLVPNHRANRGMGGSKVRDVPSNIVVLCHGANYLIEAVAFHAAEARRYGWKLESWQDPAQTPVYDRSSARWYLLDDQFGRTEVEGPNANR